MRLTHLLPALAIALAASLLSAQNTTPTRPPIIDIHVHAGRFPAGGSPACANTPAFLASDPATKEDRFGWKPVPCSNPLLPAKESYEKELFAEFERLNVIAVVMGDEKTVNQWKADAPPGRVIPGTAFSRASLSGPNKDAELKRLREAFTRGGFKVMGEVAPQYEGLSPSDPAMDEYFALAEELDIPVGIHMGTGGSGRANLTSPKFRGSMGNPLLLEDMLAKHPKLRLWVMHAGYPMIDNMLTLLQANSHVHVDVAGLIWSYPIKEVNTYIQRLVEAGFEDRVLFGTDQLLWPNLMAQSINIIETAEYLTPEQKRDILYNNAARFLRLDKDRK